MTAKTIYLWDGRAVAYLFEDQVFGWNGRQLGWFANGTVFDIYGLRTGFIKSKSPIPTDIEPVSRPGRCRAPGASGKAPSPGRSCVRLFQPVLGGDFGGRQTLTSAICVCFWQQLYTLLELTGKPGGLDVLLVKGLGNQDDSRLPDSTHLSSHRSFPVPAILRATFPQEELILKL